jgi:YD repeat-containing protein
VIGPWYDTSGNGDFTSTSANVTTNTYDAADRVTATQVNSHPATQYAYDKADNVTTITDTMGVAITSQYDRCHNLITRTLDSSGFNEVTCLSIRYRFPRLYRRGSCGFQASLVQQQVLETALTPAFTGGKLPLN